MSTSEHTVSHHIPIQNIVGPHFGCAKALLAS